MIAIVHWLMCFFHVCVVFDCCGCCDCGGCCGDGAQAEVRVEHLRQQKLLERDAAMDDIQKRRVKTLRILSKKRSHVEPVSKQRDIVAEYGDFGSQVYAPITREGTGGMAVGARGWVCSS
jgi:hypothetical protein